MRLLADWGKIGIGVSLIFYSINTNAGLLNENYACTQLMYDHGLASGAHFNCGFEYYNQAVVEEAKACMEGAQMLGTDEELHEIMTDGLKDFNDVYNQTDAPYKLCRDFAEEYSFFVRP